MQQLLLLKLFSVDPLSALSFIVGLIIGITFHEFAHAFVAYRLGDPTAKLAGRLTLNPASHLDPIGTLAILLVGIGWGKPTPFDPYNLRNPKRDAALISVAGAMSNFLIVIILTLPYFALKLTGNLTPAIMHIYEYYFSLLIWLNLILGFFNLIPIHPLDGFKVLAGILPKEWYRDFVQMERYGIFILLFLLITGVIGRILFPLVSAYFEITNMQTILSWIYSV